ncbi:MAG: efflux RND transporter periplasmic adaptor subunit [Crocinitomicaceae bacterium]|jgi:cobalt-zinc-cadmium efflux system membrane fusion protein
MKNRSIIYIGQLFLLVGIIFSFYSCNSATEEHGHEATAEESHNDSPIKEVELNEAQYDASNITLGTFELKNLSEVINANGYTKLPPQNQADVSVFMSGIVKNINVIEGEYVKKGQTLATIESIEFTKLQEEFLTSKSNLELLTNEYERQKTLNSENVNSKKTFQKAKTEYEIEKARFTSLKKQINTLNITNSENAVSTISVTAPISGYVTDVNIKIGSNAESGKPLFSIVDNSKMHVDLSVYEKDLQKVKAGQSVHFILTNQDNTEIKGQIFSIGKAFENDTKSVAVHADIINDKQMLISGMYVNALIDIGYNKVKALPTDAIVKADGREYIFVLEEHENAEIDHDKEKNHAHDDGHKHEESHGKSFHFQRIEVKTGTAQLGYTQVTVLQDISSNAKIVLKGAYYIQSHLLKSEGGGGHEH